MKKLFCICLFNKTGKQVKVIPAKGAVATITKVNEWANGQGYTAPDFLEVDIVEKLQVPTKVIHSDWEHSPIAIIYPLNATESEEFLESVQEKSKNHGGGFVRNYPRVNQF